MDLQQLHRDFPRILEKKNDFNGGRVAKYYRASYSDKNYNDFTREARTRHYCMGIMFHGTAESSVDSICRNGFYPHSDFTKSLHYAVRRGEGKDGYKKTHAYVIATAVLVNSARNLESDGHRVNDTRRLTLPLYVVEVQVSWGTPTYHPVPHQAQKETGGGVIRAAIKAITDAICYSFAIMVKMIVIIVPIFLAMWMYVIFTRP